MCNPVECFGTLPKFFTIMSRRKVSTRGGSSTTDSSGRGSYPNPRTRPATSTSGSSTRGGSAATSNPDEPDFSSLGLGTGISGRGINGAGANFGDDLRDAFNSLLGGDISSLKGFGALVNQLGNASNSAILQLLGMMVALERYGLTQSQATDWNKQLLDQMLNQILENEKRTYNESMRDEQRLYDNPQNQLARLMGSGISRDAAMQMLGEGQQPIQTEGTTPAQGFLPSEVSARNAEVAQQIAFGAMDAFSSLVDLGLSIPMALSQINASRAQTYMTEQQKSAYDAAAGAYSIISASDLPDKGSVFGSVLTTCDALTKLANSGNSAAASFIANGGIDQLKRTAPFSSPFLANLYRSERDSSDYAQRFSNEMKKMQAEIDLNNANKNVLSEQVTLIHEQVDEVRASAEYQRAATALARANEKLTGKQTEVAELTRIELELSNNLESAFQTTYIDGQSGLDLFTEKRLNDLYLDVKTLTKLRENEVWTKHADSILADYDNMISLYTLSAIYNNGAIATVEGSKDEVQDLLYFCKAADECGLFDYVHSLVEANTSDNIRSGGFGTTLPVTDAVKLYDNVVNPKKRKKR